MKADIFWEIFLETGAPEAYLLYSRALKTEGVYVPDDERAGAAGHGLQ